MHHSTRATAATPHLARDAFFDNAKLLAIVLVVVGHAWTPLRGDSHALQAAYLWVFTFHMPAFVFIAGHFTKTFDAQPRRVRRLITGLLVPYLIFETAYTLAANTLGGRDLPLSLLDPWWMTWFLLTLFLWRLTAPLWRVVRAPVLVAVAVSLVASTGDLGSTLELDRTVQMLPFFVLGLTLDRSHLDRLRRPAVRAGAVAVLAAAAIVAFLAVPHHLTEFLYWRSDRTRFADLGFGHWLAIRLALLACALAATAAFFALVPRRRLWFTALGAGTLYAYLLHGFVIKAAVWGGVYAPLQSPAGIAAVTFAAAALAVLLCTRPVRRALRWAVEPRLAWAFRPDPPAPAPAPVRAPAAPSGPDRQHALLSSAASL